MISNCMKRNYNGVDGNGFMINTLFPKPLTSNKYNAEHGEGLMIISSVVTQVQIVAYVIRRTELQENYQQLFEHGFVLRDINYLQVLRTKLKSMTSCSTWHGVFLKDYDLLGGICMGTVLEILFANNPCCV